MDDVERSARDPGQLDRSIRRLAFELGRAGQRVVARRGVPGRERLAHEHVDRVAVLGMHHHERACLGGDLHRPEERLVVDHQRALVGHEQLVGRDALVRQRRELLERAAVVRSVTAMWKPLSMIALPSRFSCQSASASANVWPCPWMQKSTWHVVPPNAAAV